MIDIGEKRSAERQMLRNGDRGKYGMKAKGRKKNEKEMKNRGIRGNK